MVFEPGYETWWAAGSMTRGQSPVARLPNSSSHGARCEKSAWQVAPN